MRRFQSVEMLQTSPRPSYLEHDYVVARCLSRRLLPFVPASSGVFRDLVRFTHLRRVEQVQDVSACFLDTLVGEPAMGVVLASRVFRKHFSD